MASILNVDKIRRAAGSTDALVIDSGLSYNPTSQPFKFPTQTKVNSRCFFKNNFNTVTLDTGSLLGY